jgi:DNA-binding CsgD family transcriptional regulator
MDAIASVLEPFTALIHEHPCYAPQSEGGVCLPLKISDFITRRQLHQLGLYQEVYKHLQTEYQMILSLRPSPGDLVALVLSNSSRDFSERDRVVLSLLQPVMQRAFALMRQRQARATLSSREADVLLWVAEAKTNKEIALILGISPRTVQKHLESIFAKLGVETRTAAALWAQVPVIH